MKHNDTFVASCETDRINTLDHGTIYNNTLGLVVVASVCISIFCVTEILKKKNREYNINSFYQLEGENSSLIDRMKLKLYKLELTTDIILIMSIIAVYVLNVLQIIFQIYGVNIDCIKLIDNKINGFFAVYGMLECICCIVAISAFFILPMYK